MIRQSYGFLYNYLKFYKLDIAIVILSLVSISICLLALGVDLRNIIDQGLAGENIKNTNSKILSMSALIIIFSVSSFFRSYFINNLSEKAINQIRIDSFRKCLELDIEEFQEFKIGDLVARFSADLDLISKLIINFLSFFLRNSIMALGAIILMFIASIKLSLIIISIVSIFLIFLLLCSKFVKKLSQSSLKIKGELYSNLLENFTYIKTIFAFNAQEHKLLQFKNSIDDYLKHANYRIKIRSLFFASAICIVLLSIIFVIWIGMLEIIEGSISSGAVISFIYYSIIAAMSIAGIAEVISDSSQSISAVQRILEIINYRVNRLENSYPQESQKSSTKIKSSIDSIEFHNIDFYYIKTAENTILNQVNFKINKGDFVCIIGKSGIGKTTILQLLLKFYSPLNGSITINNQVLAILNTKKIRSKVAYVPQDSEIFSDSIKSNIAFGKPNASLQDIIQVAEITGILKFTDQLNQGLDTKIGGNGISLSGGQKQRIAIARALLMNSDVLLLDEATSALDLKSEAKIFDKIKQIMQDKIVIFVSHRQSTIKYSNRVLELKNQKIIEKF